MAKQNTPLQIIPLGGLGEIGKNMTVVRYGEEMVVIDGGLMFPEDEMLGIDIVIPDFSYLLENREALKGIISAPCLILCGNWTCRSTAAG